MADVNPGKKNILTYAGLKKLEDELFDLKVNQRKAISEKIKEAREQGDLSENAEYDAAKDEQRDIEARIEEIEKILKNAEVFVEEEASTNAINVGCKVVIHDIEYDEDLEFAIVGSTEANSLSAPQKPTALRGRFPTNLRSAAHSSARQRIRSSRSKCRMD